MNLNLYQRLIGFLTQRRLFLVLGSAFADGSQIGRKENERHAFLAYVWDKESAVPNRVFDALEERGWRMPQLDNCKVLNLPLESNDAALINSFHAAMRGDVGIIIYNNDTDD
jgi:hypothetical protein